MAAVWLTSKRLSRWEGVCQGRQEQAYLIVMTRNVGRQNGVNSHHESPSRVATTEAEWRGDCLMSQKKCF